jgi:transcriptional regulator of arginine metabolism
MSLDERILHQLNQRPIDDQAELLALLRADGFDLTLSTLSRHLKKLQVRKEQGRYQRLASARNPVPAFTIRKVRPCLLVLKTSPGLAQALAFALDGSELPSLAGTIAGDDTIFVAPTDPERLDELEREVRERLERGY